MKPQPSCLNDYRPIALTSVVMKCFERLIKTFIPSSLFVTLDPLQFAYRPNRSTDDTIAHISTLPSPTYTPGKWPTSDCFLLIIAQHLIR